MAILHKSKARERFESADEKKPDAPQIEPDREAPPKPEFVIADHEISPSQARNLKRATGAQVLDRTGVIMEIFHRHAHSREPQGAARDWRGDCSVAPAPQQDRSRERGRLRIPTIAAGDSD
jgi:GTP-binding GTPase N-terminal